MCESSRAAQPASPAPDKPAAARVTSSAAQRACLAAGGIKLAALFQAFEPVVAQRFQQPVAGRTAVTAGGDQ